MRPCEVRNLLRDRVDAALATVHGDVELDLCCGPDVHGRRCGFRLTARSLRPDGLVLPPVAATLTGAVSGDGFHNATFEFSEGVHSVMGTIRVWHERYRYAVDVWIDKIPAAD